jgi:hypothetical protein
MQATLAVEMKPGFPVLQYIPVPGFDDRVRLPPGSRQLWSEDHRFPAKFGQVLGQRRRSYRSDDLDRRIREGNQKHAAQGRAGFNA